MCMLKFPQESHIVLAEHAQILDHVLEVGDALNSHTKGVAGVHFAVDATQVEHVGVDHAAAQNLDPACVLAEATALAATQHARNIHLGAGLGEREIAWAKAYLCVGAKELLGKIEQHLLKVGKRHVLVDIETFDLVKEAVGAGCDGFVAIDAAGADDADGRLRALHHARLHRAGVAAQHNVAGHVAALVLADEEGVLHVAGGMVGRKVERGEHVQVVFYLGAIGQGESLACENVDDVLAHSGDGVASANLLRRRGSCDVDFACRCLFLLKAFFERVDFIGSKCLELVKALAKFSLLVVGHVTELAEQGCDLALLAQVLDAQRLEGLAVVGLQISNLRF